jgi:uncharacterized protein (TIGR03663 family)
LLIYANAFLFLTLGATDAVARAIPAVAGVLVALCPWMFRQTLGRFGALVAATVLATSPTMVFASRSVDSTMLSIGLGLGFALAVRRFDRTGHASASYVAGGLAALVLISGPAAYQILVVLLVCAIIQQRSGGLWLTSAASAVDTRDAVSTRGFVASLFEQVGRSRSYLRGTAIAFGLTVAIIGTAFGTNLAGLGDSLASPLAGWATDLGGISVRSIALLPTLLLTYEPLVLVFGIVGGVLAIRSQRPAPTFLATWTVGSAVLLLLESGRHPTWSATLVLPLALLVGYAADQVLAGFADEERWRPLVVFAAATFSLVACVLIAAGNVTLPEPNVPRWVVALPVLAIVAFNICFGLWYDSRMALRATASTWLVVLLVFQVHAAMLLNPGGPLNPAEVFTGTVTSPDVRTMTSDVSTILDELQIARQLQGRPVTDNVEILVPFADPIAWYLRQYSQAAVVSALDDAPAIAIVGANDKAPPGAYVGELFQITQSATPPGLVPIDLGRWWLYRSPPHQSDTYVKVYVKTQLVRR